MLQDFELCLAILGHYALSLRPRMPHNFLDCFSFSHFFSHLLSLLELKTKFIKFCTKFLIKQVKFLPSLCTSLLLRSKPV